MVDAGLRLDLSERIALFGFFEGQFGDRAQSYAGVGGGDLAFAGSGQGDYSGRVRHEGQVVTDAVLGRHAAS